MIDRYSLPPMADIWSLHAQYARWLEVELAVVHTFEELGQAPGGTADKIASQAVIDAEKFIRIEAEVDHDVIAFIKGITEGMGDEARYFHKGMTSSDVVDTAWSLALKRAGNLLLTEAREFRANLAAKAAEHKHTLCVGRTHGIHAEPMSFGLKLLGFLAETDRNIARLERATAQISFGKISGAVGTYATLSPETERRTLEKLGLQPCPVSTQIVPRDQHAEFLQAIALFGAGIERLAVEVRHLQRTEVGEVREPFREKQRGSSAMPHKRNPILCERLTGMARLLRANAQTALENVALWHERDISHSSAERVILPDATLTLFYMLKKATSLVSRLTVFPDKMQETIARSHNLVYSQRVLLALIDKGISREEGYKLVQRAALRAWDEGIDFRQTLQEEETITRTLSPQELDGLFDGTWYLRHVDEIFGRFNL